MDRINYNPTLTETQLGITKVDLVKNAFFEYISASPEEMEAIPAAAFDAFISEYRMIPKEIMRSWMEKIDYMLVLD